MAEEKFAFESEEVSIAFYSLTGMGDAIVARKVLEALIELAPDCVVDFFAVTEAHRNFVKAFYSDIKNLNLVLDYQIFYKKFMQRYDLALGVGGCHIISLEQANVSKLKKITPKLFYSLIKISEYNKQFIFNPDSWETAALRNMIAAQILNKNCYEFLSCDGALPVHDDKVNIPLAPEYKRDFESLKLDKYITIYTDINEAEKSRPKVKTWSIKYFREYISRMKRRRPDVEIVQCGGNDVKVENADRHFLNVDLELTKYILANSLLHVGCEGGLIHLATALETTCLVFFGSSDWHYFAYERNINIASSVCEPCMYIAGDYGCVLEAEEPPCMLDITPQEALTATSNYLKNKA